MFGRRRWLLGALVLAWGSSCSSSESATGATPDASNGGDARSAGDAAAPDVAALEAATPDGAGNADSTSDRGPTEAASDGSMPDDSSTHAPSGEDAVAANDAGAAPPELPLHTNGRYIVDAKNRRFKLKAVTWYGAHLEQQV